MEEEKEEGTIEEPAVWEVRNGVIYLITEQYPDGVRTYATNTGLHVGQPSLFIQNNLV